MLVHRLAWIALVSVIFLVFAGATVRVTGSGLGCPDWPTCWGCLIPPTSPEQIDVEQLDLEKFRTHAARKGIDPDTITRDNVLESFNPMHTWIEFSNRLASLPLGLATLLLALVSWTAQRHRGWIMALAWFSLVDVIVNAVMGAIVVRTGLQPGIITLHMGLAFLLIAVLVTIIWLSRPEKETESLPAGLRRRIQIVSAILFACLFAEGLLGSQLRERTDEMALTAEMETGIEREKWNDELAATWIYKIHRSFSWTLLVGSALMFFWVRQTENWRPNEPSAILGLVVGMMIMGVILAHVDIHPVVQVLHVLATAILLAVTWHWLLRLWWTKEIALASLSETRSTRQFPSFGETRLRHRRRVSPRLAKKESFRVSEKLGYDPSFFNSGKK